MFRMQSVFLLLFGMLVSCDCQSAIAGCRYKLYYTNLSNGHLWPAGCFRCHPRKSTSTSTYGNWRDTLAETIRQRDRYNQVLAQRNQDQKHFLEALQELGLTGSLAGLDQYSQMTHYNYGGQYSNYYQSMTPQGTTAYAHSQEYAQIQSPYSNLDVNAFMQFAARYTESANQNAQLGYARASDIVDNVGKWGYAIEYVRAKGEAAERIMAALDAKETHSTVDVNATVEGRVQVSSGQDSKPTDDEIDGISREQLEGFLSERIAQISSQKCLKCHSEEKPAKGLVLTNWDALDLVSQEKVAARVVHPDPAKRMPIMADGSPGVPLTLSEIQAFSVSVFLRKLREQE